MATPFPFGSGNVLTAAQMNAITTLPINDQTASYVALVGDVGKRIVMNVASGNTVTINNSVFAVGDTIFIANKGAGATTVTAGAGVTINTEGSLVLAQHGGGTLVALSASVFTFFRGGGANYGTATGGTSSSITVSSQAYTLLAFTTDANLVVSKAGLFDVLLVGSGSGAGYIATYGGGGGGGGGVIGIQAIQTVYLPAATYAVDVGAGGASETSGLNSAIGTVIAVPGGGVGGTTTQNATKGSSGASGGGGIDSRPGGSTVFSVGGNAGGNSSGGATAAGAGGGGSSSAGGAAIANVGGAGGNGLDISSWITGATYYVGAGGGGGGAITAGAAGNGGVAGKTSGAGNNGVNYGAGGGGAMTAGGAGAAGVVYVRFKV